ncbi:MAG: hypothetical protein GJU73_06400 [Ferrovum sp.]|jgi:hypothetical protein|uniref:hypothetical protein n=1 Tax=Ferrovum sp. TaxID=2609467 RepID=UPI0026047D60|nr:hypothetical protein [Ferrovum sp.]MBW8067063.1 hypothetical protein [Ferrovum sp.]
MATTEQTVLRDIYTIAFQISPIIFKNGIVSKVPGGVLPVVALLGQLGLIQSAISTGNININDFSFQFRPMPGSDIINQSVATYPFANQRVAANATIQEPLNVSLHMIAPVKVAGGYATKLPQITLLKTLFEKHSNAGGTYIILTPAYIYVDCLMLKMTDITSGETKQDQVAWQLDYFKPLISLSAAKTAMSSLMAKQSGGQQITSNAWSGPSVGTGTSMPGAGSSFGFGTNNLISSLSKYIPGI